MSLLPISIVKMTSGVAMVMARLLNFSTIYNMYDCVEVVLMIQSRYHFFSKNDHTRVEFEFFDSSVYWLIIIYIYLLKQIQAMATKQCMKVLSVATFSHELVEHAAASCRKISFIGHVSKSSEDIYIVVVLFFILSLICVVFLLCRCCFVCCCERSCDASGTRARTHIMIIT